MKCIILHGTKLHPSGVLPQDLLKRIEVLHNLLRNDPHDLLVISGGISGKAPKPEAVAISEYLGNTIDIPLKLETNSKTTVQNIKNTFRLIEGEKINKLTVITSKSSLQRFKHLYKYYFPAYYENITFVAAENTRPLITFIYEAFLSALYLINPREYFISPFLKIFRS